MKHSSARRGAFGALVVGVAGLHLLLLTGMPPLFRADEAGPARALVTRTITLAPPVQVARPAVTPAQPQPLRSPAVAAPERPAAQAAPPQVAALSPPRPATEPHAHAASFAIPGSARFHYTVQARRGGQTWEARGELEWRHDGHSYDAKLEISAPLLPTRTQRSAGAITPEGLAPRRFSDKGRSEEAAHFQRDQGKVSFSSNRPDAPLLAGAQDRLSVLLQLGAMIAGDPARFPPGAVIEIQTAGTRDAEPWRFTVEGEETLALPGGSVRALKLTRNPRKEFDQKVELWLSLSMDYVPVRLRLTQPNGDWIDQLWASTDKG
ncbi:MAG TPA: DUF3108 domain-containing protein [Ramlibacter sp.]|nr:DUF3108 domain-containing protein [Ramlibacter sp.]